MPGTVEMPAQGVGVDGTCGPPVSDNIFRSPDHFGLTMVPPRLLSVPYKAADAMTPSLARRRKGMPGRVRRAVQLAARRCTCRSEL